MQVRELPATKARTILAEIVALESMMADSLVREDSQWLKKWMNAIDAARAYLAEPPPVIRHATRVREWLRAIWPKQSKWAGHYINGDIAAAYSDAVRAEREGDKQARATMFAAALKKAQEQREVIYQLDMARYGKPPTRRKGHVPSRAKTRNEMG